MEVSEYFFDTYALIELIKAKASYLKYGEAAVRISFFNLVELAYSVYLEFGEEKAQELYGKFETCVQEISWEVTLGALQLKHKYRKRHLSYADCIGYAFAKHHHLLFLTGDEGFRDLDNVEFVK